MDIPTTVAGTAAVSTVTASAPRPNISAKGGTSKSGEGKEGGKGGVKVAAQRKVSRLVSSRLAAIQDMMGDSMGGDDKDEEPIIIPEPPKPDTSTKWKYNKQACLCSLYSLIPTLFKLFVLVPASPVMR